MTNASYFRFDDDNPMKYKISYNHHSQNGEVDNTYPRILDKGNWRNKLNHRHIVYLTNMLYAQ